VQFFYDCYINPALLFFLITMKPFGSASELLIAVNNYLDSIQGSVPQSAEEARERVKRILEFRDEMEAFHFKNPRFAVMHLMRILQNSMNGMDREDLAELAPELSFLRYTYEQRRIAYDRARAAYIANRAAERIYRSNLFKDLLRYLPYGGEYIAALERYGGTALLVYRKILEELGVRDPQLAVDLEGDVEEIRPEPGIFGDRVSTEVLVSTVLRAALADKMPGILAEERRTIPNYDRMLDYERIVRKYNALKMKENPYLLWNLLQELEEKGFLKGGDVDPEIIEALRKRREIRFHRIYDAAMSKLRRFLRDYYLLVPERVRKNAPLFPGLPATPERLEGILSDDALHMLREKILLESALRMPSKHLGLAILHLNSNVPIETLAREYSVDVGQLQSAVSSVRAARESDRVRRFLDMVRRNGKD